MNLLIIWWILDLVLLLKVEGLDGVCVGGSALLCDCFSPSKTTHSIECCGDKIIQLERYDQEIVYELSDLNCKPKYSNSSSCLTNYQKSSRLNHEDKVKIYNSCSGKKRCNITVIQSQNIRIHIPMTCEPASYLYNTTESLPSTFSSTRTIFYIADNDYSGKHITYSCTANQKVLFRVLYINLGPESCKKVKIYSKGETIFRLVCTDTGLTMFYKYIGLIGTEFSLEMEDLKLEKNKVIYLKLYAYGSYVYCNGSQNTIPGIPSTPSTTENNDLSRTENSKMADEDGINPHALYGGIIAALIVITIICIGVYCFLRNRKKQKEATTNVAMSNRKETNSDNSHYNYVDITDAQITNSSNDNREHIPKTDGKAPGPVYFELEAENQKSAKEKTSDYDHIGGDKLSARDTTPVYNRDNYDHIKSTSLQGVINNPYNHIGDNIQDSDHNRIIAKGNNSPATKSDGSNHVDDTYNHLNK